MILIWFRIAQPMKFFAGIAIEMSNQLRNLVVDSLAEFVAFFEQYKVKPRFLSDCIALIKN